jgi:hypothetical protein
LVAANSILISSSEQLKMGFTLISSGLKFIWKIIFYLWLKASIGRSLVGTHRATY